MRVGARRNAATGGNQTTLYSPHLSRSGALLVLEEEIMDKNRVVGSAKQVKGAVKQVVGKAVGDSKLKSEGKADKIEGKVQNTIGGIEDALKRK